MEFKRDPRFGRMIPAMVTPFNADLELDLDRAQELADRLVRGADALIVSGTTGERSHGVLPPEARSCSAPWCAP